MKIRLGRMALIALLAVFSGCASLSPEVPEEFDLTGEWQLNAALSDTPSLAALGGSAKRQGRNPRGAGPGSGNKPQGRGQRGGGRQGGGSRGRPAGGASSGNPGSVRVPVLVATNLVIEQNFESMGVEYDGSNYRDVSWGERKRGVLRVEAGWKDDQLVIKTEGGRFPIEETYTLSDNGSRLTTFVELAGGKDDMRFKRVFEKVTVNED